MALVFQYGSNTSVQRLNAPDRLCGDARSLGLAFTLEAFELDFTVCSKKNKCAAADIIPNSGRQIWGVLYEIPDNLISRDTSGKRKSLDEIEGKKYERMKIRVCKAIDPETPTEALTYVVIDREYNLRTSHKYVTYILKGLREHGAPTDYIEYVKGRIINNNPDLSGYI